MPDPTPPDLPGADRYRHWKPEYQERALELLKARQNNPWRPFYCPIPDCNGHPHCLPVENVRCTDRRGHPWVDQDGWVCDECGVKGTLVDEWAWEHARDDQKPPKWSEDWLVWLLSGGRGSGKTRSGSELSHRMSEYTPRMIFVAPTGPDFRETMVEGISGLLATAPPGKKPAWEPSKKKLTWPNGCIGMGYSAEEPDRLRGPESGFIWADEPAHYPNPEAVWDNMQFGLRLRNMGGLDNKIVATTTPLPTPWMKELVADDATVVHRVATYVNLRNLADNFRRRVLAKYEGTRQGKQELHGELLEDVEGALWQWEMFLWAKEAPHLERIVVSVDPAGTANKKSDKTGIIVVGMADRRFYVLADLTGTYSPGQWADIAVGAYNDFSADAIVAEKNYGGDMVRHTLENSREARALQPRIIEVDSRRGKEIRAEPVVALYEKRRVYHVGERGDLSDLEGEQTEWVPGTGPSPNRVDAEVHGITELAKHLLESEFASPRDLRQYHAPVSRHLHSVRGAS